MRAPAESANHSTGTPRRSARSSAAMTRRHSCSATEPSDFVGSPQSTTRCTPSGCSGVGVVTTAARMPAVFEAVGPVDRHELTGVVEVVLDERAAGSGEHAAQLVGVDEPATTRAHHLGGVVVRGGQQVLRGLLDAWRPRRIRAGR